MTQSVWSQNGTPESCEQSSEAVDITPLTRLIRAEFSEQRLAATLDLGRERVPERLWTASL